MKPNKSVQVCQSKESAVAPHIAVHLRGCRKIGLHERDGSGTEEESPWLQMCRKLTQVAAVSGSSLLSLNTHGNSRLVLLYQLFCLIFHYFLTVGLIIDLSSKLLLRSLT